MESSLNAHAERLPQQWAASMHAVATTNGTGWLPSLRAAAARELLKNGLPGNKDEAWKYTSLRRLEQLREIDGKPTVASATADAQDWNTPLAEFEGYGFGFRCGSLHWLEQAAPEGVILSTFRDAVTGLMDDGHERLRRMLEAVDFSGRSRAFAALNTALLDQGVVIHVAAGVDGGTCLAQWAQADGRISRLANFRLIVLLEEGARLNLLEQHLSMQGQVAVEPPSSSDAQGLNLVMQADLGKNAQLHHFRVQQDADNSVLLTFSDVYQAADSTYTYAGIDIGGGLVRHDLYCRLAGPGARAELNGAFVLDGERLVDHHICVDHEAPACSSEQFFRGVLGGSSRGVFNGKALIRPGADGSRVRQSNANLLLSDLAEMDTKPELEIYADEVEASHGATVGQLDEQAVFYLRSRGLAKADARRMLTTAFCRAVSSRISDLALGEQIAGLLDAAVSGLNIVEENSNAA